jgi:hypothetical protein
MPLLAAGRFDFMDVALRWLGDSTATKKQKTEKSFRISDHFGRSGPSSRPSSASALHRDGWTGGFDKLQRLVSAQA